MTLDDCSLVFFKLQALLMKGILNFQRNGALSDYDIKYPGAQLSFCRHCLLLSSRPHTAHEYTRMSWPNIHPEGRRTLVTVLTKHLFSIRAFVNIRILSGHFERI